MPPPTYDCFLSHNSDDKPTVEALARLLAAAGFQVWLDKWNLIPGNPWQEEIEQTLGDCASCCVCIGPGEMGPWQNEEMRAAIGRRVSEGQSFRVIPVLLPGSARPERSKLPAFLAQTTWVEFEKTIDEEEGLHRLQSAIRGFAPGPGPGQAIFEGVCPYRGLEVFDVEHAPFFFGRAALTEWLLEELRPRQGRSPNRFLGIVGASGSGKSSLARAGLLAQLKQGALAGSADWPRIILKPGSDPLESLAVRLAGSPTEAAELKRQLAAGPGQLHLTARFMLRDAPEDRRLVVLVDQFEEVFSLCRDPELRRDFIDNLLYAATEPLGQTLVLLTMRADFYGKCAEHDALAAALADHQLLVGPMNEPELREAIEQPAFRAGFELEPGLTDLLIQNILSPSGGQSGGLPLLQYALSRLWEERKGNRLTLEGYQKIGGLRGALERRADEIYGQMDGKQKAACRRIFLRLTEPGEGTEDTRRRARLSELGTDAATQTALQALIGGRLVTSGEGDQDLVEVSHEALIRGWPLLQGWVEADREALRVQHRLSAAAREWIDHDRDPDYLYRGGRLSQGEDWARDRGDHLSKDERAFLEASVDLRDAEAARLEEQRRKELEQAKDLADERARSATRLKAVLGVIVLALVVTVGIAGYAIVQQQKATLAEAVATAREQDAVAAKEEAGEQRDLAQEERARADEKAKEAKREAWKAKVQKSEAEKKRDLAYTNIARFFATEAGGRNLADQPTLRLLLAAKAASISQTTKTDGAMRKVLADVVGVPLRGHQDEVCALDFSPDGKLLASASWDKTVRLWDPATGKPLRTLEGHGGFVNSVAFSPDGKLLASASSDKTVRLWDPATGEPLRTLEGHGGSVESVAFSPDGKLLASASEDGMVRLWDPATGEPLRTLEGHGDYVLSVAFSPDGKLLASASGDNTVRRWDPATGKPLRTLEGHGERVWSLAFSPDGKLLASASQDGTVRLRDPATGEPLRTLEGHGDSVSSVAFSPDGKLLASASEDGTVRLWDPATGEPLLTLEGHGDWVNSVAFSPDGKLLASASYDETVRLWDPATGKPLRTLQGDGGSVSSVAFSPDGKLLASASADKTVRLWWIPWQEMLAAACRRARRNFSLEEWRSYLGEEQYTRVCPDLPLHPSVVDDLVSRLGPGTRAMPKTLAEEIVKALWYEGADEGVLRREAEAILISHQP